MASPSFAGGVGLESGGSAAVVLARFRKSCSFSSLKPWQVARRSAPAPRRLPLAGRPVAGPGGWRRRAAPPPAAPLSPGPGPAAALVPGGWPVASARAVSHCPSGSCQQQRQERGTESAQGAGGLRGAAGGCPALPSPPEGSSGTAHHAPSPHLTPETRLCDAAGKEKAHVNTANE